MEMVSDTLEAIRCTEGACDTPKPRRAGGRPISAAWRFDAEGKLVVLNPTRRDYNIGNYKQKGTLQCELCGREMVWKHIKRHQEDSKICGKLQTLRMLMEL